MRMLGSPARRTPGAGWRRAGRQSAVRHASSQLSATARGWRSHSHWPSVS